ncbi:hypothetical protein [Methylomicrobium album]|uniref:hypothetical protein n=1 Tax=Methylomicrobium album TaxID=39775 RepID=UPI00020D8F50|nr:hypothetical protein [Methylomicrobium album]
MLCKHCGSENIKRFSVVCDEGTSVESISASSKPVWNTKPFSPFGKQKVKGTRTLKTELAKRCSPPSDPESFVVYLAAFPGMIIGGYFGLSAGVSWGSFWLGLIVFVVVMFGLMFGGAFAWRKFLGGNKSIQNYRVNLNAWQRSWYCSKCGGTTIS